MKRLLCILMFLFPAQAWATGCDCGSISSMVTSAQVLTVELVNANTAAEAMTIRSEITLAAQNIIGTIKTESATIVRAIVGLKESNAAMIKGQAAASEAMKTEDLYGKASQPSGLCGASSLGAGLQVGLQAGTQVRSAMRDKQREYGSREGARPVEYLERIIHDDHPDAKAMTDALFPMKDTLTEDQVAEAHESIKTLTNPRPLPVVTDAQRNSPAGQTYAAARLIHEGRLAVVTESLNSHVIFHAPTLPDEVTSWAQNQWSEAGGSGTPPGIVNGKLSEAGLYKLLSQMRLGNPNWFVQVTGATEAGLLRELVMMQSVQLELTRKNNELLERLSFNSALEYLTRMEGTDGKAMTDLYTRMVGSQQ
jgi:hypothetical protein